MDRDAGYSARATARARKSFYYAFVNKSFVFASEIKGLLDWPGLKRGIDYEAMIDFLTFGFVFDPKNIWRSMRKLAPAHAMTVELREDGCTIASEPRRFWSLPFASRSSHATAEEIRSTLLRASNEMAISDEPFRTIFSGGVDSSTVTAALSLSGHSVRNCTIGFDDAAYDEPD